VFYDGNYFSVKRLIEKFFDSQFPIGVAIQPTLILITFIVIGFFFFLQHDFYTKKVSLFYMTGVPHFFRDPTALFTQQKCPNSKEKLTVTQSKILANILYVSGWSTKKYQYW
jgi:hypothetical protein